MRGGLRQRIDERLTQVRRGSRKLGRSVGRVVVRGSEYRLAEHDGAYVADE
jgi:hypothetical protein